MHRLAPLLALLAACADDGGKTCPVASSGDGGDLAALKAQRCNVPGSMGGSHWYRLSATLPEQIVQLELWDGRGPFTGSTVEPGTFTIGEQDADPATCGVCLRAIADKGGPNETEYYASAGTVEVAAVAPDASAPFVATITNATFEEVNAKKARVTHGCTGDVARVKVSGTMELVGGTGGGGGGGGGSGNGCVTTVGD